jgi:hypothetical protein
VAGPAPGEVERLGHERLPSLGRQVLLRGHPRRGGGAEHGHQRLRGLRLPGQHPPLELEARRQAVEALAHVLLDGPLVRQRLVRGRGVAAAEREQLGGEALLRPGRHPDRPTRAHHAKQLLGDHPWPRSDHGAEHRADAVEAGVLERERLGVGLDPLDVVALGLCADAPAIDHARREVRGHHACALARAREREVAVAGRHVEHLLAGRDRAGVRERLGGGPQGLREGRVVAEPPDLAVALLDRVHVHGASVSSEWRR